MKSPAPAWTPDPEIEAALEKSRNDPQWVYRAFRDKLGRGKIRIARLFSLNDVNFGFPYSGPQPMRLELREHPKYGHDVILTMERGQFMTSAIAVRFDDGPVQTFTLHPAAWEIHPVMKLDVQ